jgi:hypothetical protein
MGYAIYSNIHVYPIAFASFGNFFVRSPPASDSPHQEKHNKAHVLTEAKRKAMWRCAHAREPKENRMGMGSKAWRNQPEV